MGRPTGWGDGAVRPWQSVWEETERMERERESEDGPRRDSKGHWGGRERVKETQLYCKGE